MEGRKMRSQERGGRKKEEDGGKRRTEERGGRKKEEDGRKRRTEEREGRRKNHLSTRLIHFKANSLNG